MSSRPIRLAMLALLAVSGWLLADWYFSDQQKLQRRLAGIQKLAAKSPAESDIAALATARQLSDLFAEPFSVSAEPEGFSTNDRRSLISGIHSFRQRTSTLVLEISGLQIYIDDDGTDANTFLTARFLNNLADLRSAERFDVRVHWVKIDGDWLISDVRLSRVGS